MFVDCILVTDTFAAFEGKNYSYKMKCAKFMECLKNFTGFLYLESEFIDTLVIKPCFLSQEMSDYTFMFRV